MWRIFVPLSYLSIDHPEKMKFDIYLPFLLALFIAAPLFSTEFRAGPLSNFNVVENLSDFLGILTGFFIAALAAVATFGKREMDDPMPGEPPVRLEHRVNTETYFENLTRRRFLSLLFGYLAFLSLTLYIAGFGYLVLDKYALDGNISSEARTWIFSCFWVLYSICLGSIISNTYLGLFYLCDRIHRPNKTLKTGGRSSRGSVDS